MPTAGWLNGGVFDAELVDLRPGFASVLISGRGAGALYRHEAGGHRVQRIPPTEKRGRVQTSTVTVAVLDPDSKTTYKLNEADIEIRVTRGSGPGGQHRNKVESCVVATHRPSGTSVRVDMRSQHQSRSVALQILGARLAEADAERSRQEENTKRKVQIGCGMRSDKVKTYRTQDDTVTDHRTERRTSLKQFLRGFID